MATTKDDALVRLSRELGNSPWLSVVFLLRDRCENGQLQDRKDARAVADFIVGL
mgnify:CR=1 FL=1